MARRSAIAIGCALALSTLFPAAPAVAEWTDPVCEVDGAPEAGLSGCVPPADAGGTSFDPNSCAGARTCEQTYAELEGTQFADPIVRDEDDRAIAELDVRLSRGSGVAYAGWTTFALYDGKQCRGTVRDNGHCGWLYHKFRAVTDQGPRPGVFVTAFPARSGNNYPPQRWVRNVGPVPDRFKGSAGGKVRDSFRWGRMHGSYTGFEWDSRSSFFPGKWRLDPWVIYKPGSSRTRSSFEIHGGRRSDGGASLWTTRTAGCIRLSIKGIRGLKSKWDNRTDNRRRASLYVVHHG
ncbi:MAG: hypothetical protein WD206_03895 [Actinomycetota bacterium]